VNGSSSYQYEITLGAINVDGYVMTLDDSNNGAL
jgi:hypothetical protein